MTAYFKCNIEQHIFYLKIILTHTFWNMFQITTVENITLIIDSLMNKKNVHEGNILTVKPYSELNCMLYIELKGSLGENEHCNG